MSAMPHAVPGADGADVNGWDAEAAGIGCQPGCTPWPPALAERYRALGYWRGESLADLLVMAARRHGERIALVAGEVRWSYNQLLAESLRLARGFAALGIRPQDRVVVQLGNQPEFFSVIFALFRLGALPVFALPAHRRLEITHFCRHAQAVAYITAPRLGGFDSHALAHQARAACPGLRHVLMAGDSDCFPTLRGLPSAAVAPLPPAPAASAVAFLQLSGGSTGTPKLIPRTHDEYFYTLRESARICALTDQSTYLCVLPAAHNFALSSPGTLGVLWAGGVVVLADDGSPGTAFELIRRECVTITALVPSLVPVWLAAAARAGDQLASLQVLQVGGARFDPQLARRVVQEFPAVLQQVFGMAEGLVNYTRLDDSPRRIASTQGHPISPDDEIRIVDDDDQPVADGEIGHLLTRGPYTIRGYYHAEAHNARAFTPDGYYRTGDMVRRTTDGDLVVEGRAKDQINRGGEKVAAEEVELLLMTHPGVHDAALVAMPDAHLGEKSCAFVIRRDPALRAVDLVRFARGAGVADFKVPDHIEFVDVFPQTPVGKIDKRALRVRIAEQLQTTNSALQG
ncbi:MAG: (2,3-dihydroxybenzoyl)adenylate synthase [Pseudomonadota bacterium]|nr:(2,3-dihydroxybenzoyl)adenylate synthase [Pseudomonadota bacterium]